MTIRNFIYLKKKPSNSKFKTIIFFTETVKMYPCIELLITLWSGKPFFNNCTVRAVIKNKKVVINKLQIDIGGIIYTQKLNLTYSRGKSISAVNLFDLKRLDILAGYLCYSKK